MTGTVLIYQECYMVVSIIVLTILDKLVQTRNLIYCQRVSTSDQP